MKALLYRNIVILVYVLLMPLVGFSQRAGDLDRSFNYGRGENYGFNFNMGASNLVFSHVVQTDGKIIIGGQFNSYNSTTRNHIARLNTDGSLDETFNPGTGAGYLVWATALQADGKIIIGGDFTSYNETTRNRIARLNADGSLDASFNPAAGPNNRVRTIAIQADGKIIIGGSFNSFNGTRINRIARLNSDGSLDSTFNLGMGATGAINPDVNTIAVQADGRIIIGGDFNFFNGNTRNHIARLNADGSIDTSFNIGTGANYGVTTVALQPDGKIIIGGNFSSFNGTSRNRIARLNADGSLDASFNPGTGANNTVNTTALQVDGKIIIGGDFTSFNGNNRNRIVRLYIDGSLDTTFNQSEVGTIWTSSVQVDGQIIIGGSFRFLNSSSRSYIARLNANGSLDSTFNPATGPNYVVQTTSQQTDGKIIIGGSFNYFNGETRNYITRLNSDGSLDATFNTGTGPNAYVNTTAVQVDGKIIIGGEFTSYNGVTRNRIARLNSDGSLDATFNPGIGAEGGSVLTTALQADGKIIIGGFFNSYNGTTRNGIARLNADGSLDAAFNPGTGVNGYVKTSAVQANGKIIIGGFFTSFNGTAINRIARLNADGSLDGTFNPGTGPNRAVYTSAVQTNGKIIIGGDFNTINSLTRIRVARLNANGSLDGTFNPGTGANSLVETVALQPDGKLIIGGTFDSFNSTSRNRIARLNVNGSLDATFITGTGANGWIYTTSVQADGKIIIGGNFTRYDNLSTPYIARIHESGGCTTPATPTITTSGTTTLCTGSSLVLTSSSANGNLWSTGDTTRSILITTPGNYSVRVIVRNCTSAVSSNFEVILRNPSQSNINQLICQGNSYLFGGFQRTTNGIYYDTLTNSVGCDSIITLNLTIDPIPFTPTITGDTALCSGNTTRLSSSLPIGNLWSTGDTTQFINVAQAGNYTVRVTNGGCTSAASAPFSVVNAGPSPTLINFDTTSNRCLGARLQLTPSGTFAHYYWNTGERTRSIYTRTSGQYSVQVANSDSCFGLPSPPIFIAFDTNWCSVEIFRVGLDSITANVWADYYIWYLDGIELLSSNTLKTIPIQGDGVYTFRAVVGGRTSPQSNPIVITSAIKSINAPKLKLNPNPTSGIVTLTTGTEAESIAITNAVGQLVYTTKAQPEMELNLNNLAKGVYMVQVQSNKGVSTQRLVIQ